MVVTLGKGRTRSLNYSLSTKARFVLQRKFEEWGPRSKTLLRKRNIHAVLTWHCVILAETHAHWRWFFTWHRTWHNSVVTDIWPLTPWMLQWGTGISRYQLQSQGIMQSNNCLHVWPRTIYKGSETSERDLENKHAMVKRDLPGHQIQPFLVTEKEMEARGGTLTYPRLPSWTNRNYNSKRSAKERSDSQSWLQLQREGNFVGSKVWVRGWRTSEMCFFRCKLRADLNL